MEFDVVIEGGTVVTASDTFSCDVGIKAGKIAVLGQGLGAAAERIDARGKLVMPGAIDSHVHISQPSGPGIVMADDFASGTKSALMGGNTTILPFCLQEKGQSLREAISAYHALADGNCFCNVSFHLIITDPTPHVLGQELPALVEDGYTSLKVFMTYEGLRLLDHEILATLDAARRTGALVMVHCENEDAIRYLIGVHEARGDLAPKFHANTRPQAVEREATHRAISLAEVVDVPIVIVHVSNGQAIEEIARAKARGRKVVSETCPQYLMLTAEDLDGMDWEGAKFVCSPPPRDKASQDACWLGLETGAFDLFSSDHCPFRYEDPEGKLNEKGRQSFRWVPNGIPGVETRLPILFSEGVGKGRISLNDFVALTSTNHAKLYGLYPRKGTIAVGADADIAIWDPNVERVIRQKDLHHGADYTPYEGLQVKGWPVRVLLSGKTAAQTSGISSSGPLGEYLLRSRSILCNQETEVSWN
jgi:dihydropyrimidinase